MPFRFMILSSSSRSGHSRISSLVSEGARDFVPRAPARAADRDRADRGRPTWEQQCAHRLANDRPPLRRGEGGRAWDIRTPSSTSCRACGGKLGLPSPPSRRAAGRGLGRAPTRVSDRGPRGRSWRPGVRKCGPICVSDRPQPRATSRTNCCSAGSASPSAMALSIMLSRMLSLWPGRSRGAATSRNCAAGVARTQRTQTSSWSRVALPPRTLRAGLPVGDAARQLRGVMSRCPDCDLESDRAGIRADGGPAVARACDRRADVAAAATVAGPGGVS